MEIVPERAGGCENCKYRAMDETQEPCAHCTKKAVDNYEPMTNGDYVRSLSDTELAQTLGMKHVMKTTDGIQRFRIQIVVETLI